MSISIAFRVLLMLGSILSGGCAIGERTSRAARLDESRLNDNFFGLWVTRWDFQQPDDVIRVIHDASELGVTDLFWQVRGQGDAFYRSPIESWGQELTLRRDQENKPINDRSRSLDPGFDPLELAISEAHRVGINLHAWVNVMPMWKGQAEPIDPGQLWRSHPRWRLSDEQGREQTLSSGYVVINPVLDEVQDYLVGVVADIVDRYDVDGVHLDYIRFLSDELGDERLYPGDARSLSLYSKMVGDRATPGQINRSRYREWIRDRISHLVERIGRESLRGHDRVIYSAAVWRRPDLAQDRYLQDATRWVNDGVVDLVMPMIYTDKDSQFEGDLDAWSERIDRRRIIPGIGVYKHSDPSQTLSQLTIGHPRRFVLFAYSSICESANPDQDQSTQAREQRRAMRDRLALFIERVRD